MSISRYHFESNDNSDGDALDIPYLFLLMTLILLAENIFNYLMKARQQRNEMANQRAVVMRSGINRFLQAMMQEKEVDSLVRKVIQLGVVDGKILNLTLNKNLLTKDFALPADIYAKRFLEYLNPERAKHLLFFMLELAKPGTRFHFEIYNPSKRNATNQSESSATQYIKPGFVPSFFGGRTDIRFHLLETKKEKDNSSGNIATTERLTVEKFRR